MRVFEALAVMVRVPCVSRCRCAARDARDRTRARVATGGRWRRPGAGAAVPPSRFPRSFVAARRPAPCISTPRRVRVRARHTTRLAIRVHANGQNISGALVRVTLPGGAKLFRRTRSDGIAHRFVRPSRSGTLVIQSDVCFGSSRVKVLRARSARLSARA